MTTSTHSVSAGKPVIRPEWTPATIALMVLGFIVFWPLGLAMLAYIIWGDRLPALKRDINRATDSAFSGLRRGSSFSHAGAARTGNVAFDDWREAELKRLDEERARLETMRDEFEEYARELRRAKDQEEFDRFMAARDQRSRTSGSSGQTIDAE